MGTTTPPFRYSIGARSLTVTMTDADTVRNLRWQRDTNGETAKLTTWKVEARPSPVSNSSPLCSMQPGEAYIVLGHSMATIYSTATDNFPWQDRPLHWGPKRNAGVNSSGVASSESFEWTKCKVLDDPTALQEWYANDRSQYGKLRDFQQGDEAKVDVSVPQMIALPLRAAQLYQKFGGAVMPHNQNTPRKHRN